MNKHLHWEFVGGESGDAEGVFKNSSFITVIGFETEETALIRAKEILTRPTYFLRHVFECELCVNNRKLLENQEKHIKRVEKMSGLEKRPWEKTDE